ncbi:Gfo/Idh/MocA family oxidoreductase [Lacticaseibacillus zhaodongensis]|uniref:Gfo/Idh/MocA family oxidoreductase n=1 Tax=Lacticaseibacillus zhaodongensis TaxID=2668065 RepID=UPI001E5B7562|nr:Gfo/Idh/MocA family oxidoreductase [Lacticaseibacillus zhaodongensis]
MLKIGVMGLGNIAQKAYLPVMAGMQDEYDWYLCTRNAEKGHALAAKYGFTNVFQTVDQLVAAGMDAVFVHTPTTTHPQILRQGY